MKNSKKLDINRLLHDLDALKPERLPLGLHYAADCDLHSRECYATTLAAFMLAGGALSEAQSRLFKMLLSSMGLEGQQAALFARATGLELNDLREFLRIIEENKLARSFCLDALVLARLDAPLVEQQKQLLSELVDLLYVSEDDLALIAMLAANILQLPEVNAPFDLKTFDISFYCAWNEFIFRPVDVSALVKGLSPGLWQVDEVLEVDSPWSLRNVHIRFVGNGRINTNAKGEVIVADAHVERPVMLFTGALNVSMRSSRLYGEYDVKLGLTAITIKDIEKAYFQSIHVSTKDARSFLIYSTPCHFYDCHFLDCGNDTIIGGAIASRKTIKDEFAVELSSFENCHSLLGGAIRADSLFESAIVNSSFVNCRSSEKQDGFDVSQLAICARHAYYKCIKNSVFRNNSVLFECLYSCPREGCNFDDQFMIMSLCKASNFNLNFVRDNYKRINSFDTTDYTIKYAWPQGVSRRVDFVFTPSLSEY